MSIIRLKVWSNYDIRPDIKFSVRLLLDIRLAPRNEDKECFVIDHIFKNMTKHLKYEKTTFLTKSMKKNRKKILFDIIIPPNFPYLANMLRVSDLRTDTMNYGTASLFKNKES